MIKIDNMKWARKPNPEIAHTSAVVKRVGDVLSVGDVILVKIINKIKDTHLWDLALEQDPIVEAALMCIEADTGHVKAMVGGTGPFSRVVNPVPHLNRSSIPPLLTRGIRRPPLSLTHLSYLKIRSETSPGNQKTTPKSFMALHY